MLMGMSMKENGEKIKLMALGFTFMLMVRGMRGNGMRINSMEKD
jgi:hypothetical protein